MSYQANLSHFKHVFVEGLIFFLKAPTRDGAFKIATDPDLKHLLQAFAKK